MRHSTPGFPIHFASLKHCNLSSLYESQRTFKFYYNICSFLFQKKTQHELVTYQDSKYLINVSKFIFVQLPLELTPTAAIKPKLKDILGHYLSSKLKLNFKQCLRPPTTPCWKPSRNIQLHIAKIKTNVISSTKIEVVLFPFSYDSDTPNCETYLINTFIQCTTRGSPVQLQWTANWFILEILWHRNWCMAFTLF